MSEEDLAPGRQSPRPLDVPADRWTRPESRLGRRALLNFIKSLSTPRGYANVSLRQAPLEHLYADHHHCSVEMTKLRVGNESLLGEANTIGMHRSGDEAVIRGLVEYHESTGANMLKFECRP